MKLKQGNERFSIESEVPLVQQDVHPYVVFLLNASDWVVVGVLQNGSFRAIQPFGRTCSGDLNQCVDQQKYVPITMSNCNEPVYTLGLRIQNPRDGKQYNTGTVTVSPDCSYRGEVVKFAEPLP